MVSTQTCAECACIAEHSETGSNLLLRSQAQGLLDAFSINVLAYDSAVHLQWH